MDRLVPWQNLLYELQQSIGQTGILLAAFTEKYCADYRENPATIDRNFTNLEI